MILTRAQMLKVEGRKYKVLDVPELNGQVRIASLSAGCGLKLKALTEAKEAGADRKMSLEMFKSSIVDEAGAPVFDEATAEAFLDSISAETMTLIVQEITALSGRGGKPKAANGAEEAAPTNPSPGSQALPLPTA